MLVWPRLNSSNFYTSESWSLDERNDENMSMIDFLLCLLSYSLIIFFIRFIYAFSRKYMSSRIYERIRHVNNKI